MTTIRLNTVFRYTAGFLLLVTALVKLVSSFGHAHILKSGDPIFYLQFGRLMLAAGFLELIIAIICFFSKSRFFAAILIAWLATNLLAYRLGLLWIDWHEPCPCLGNLTDALRIPPQTADMAMKIVLAYLLLGSYGTLLWPWWQRRKTAVTIQKDKASTAGMVGRRGTGGAR